MSNVSYTETCKDLQAFSWPGVIEAELTDSFQKLLH